MRFFIVTLATLAAGAVVPAFELSPVSALNERDVLAGVDISVGTSVDASVGGVVGDAVDGIVGGFLGGSAGISIDLFNGLDAKGSAAFAGAALGAKASDIEAGAKASLEAWIGSCDLSASLKSSLKSWCYGSAALSADVIAELGTYVPFAIGLAAEGGLSVTIDGITAVAAHAGVALDAALQAALSTYLKAHADLESEVIVALHVCAIGGTVEILTEDIRAALSAYLKSSDCRLSSSLIAAIELWLEGKTGTGVSIIGDIPTAASITASIGATISAIVNAEGIVIGTGVSSIKIWLAGLEAELDTDIKAALELLIQGKAAISLADEVVIKLAAWLFSKECTLTGQLKAVVLVWLYVRATVVETISVLSEADIATLSAWLDGEISASLSVVVKGVIATAIAGEAVVNVSLEAVSELVAVITGLVSGVSVDVDIVLILAKWVTGNTCSCS